MADIRCDDECCILITERTRRESLIYHCSNKVFITPENDDFLLSIIGNTALYHTDPLNFNEYNYTSQQAMPQQVSAKAHYH